MRHARDGAAAAMSAASRILVARGKNEPQEMENPDVAWGQRARDGVWVPTKDGQRIHLGIDVAAADTVAQVLRPSLRVFVGVDVDTDIVAQTTDNGVRLLTVVHGPDAPSEFRFPISLADGLALEAMPSGGYDVVHLRYGATVGRLYNPWASDSMFRQVKADYTLEGSAVTMRVQHTDAYYPVVADPHYAR
ncbi:MULTISPECIES: hypothetical protein [Actinomadura]|uniref:Uncharacterized protein n=2 Tax=Actinomadura TaxID=1988 RepID=A0A7D3VSE7_ACTVE|nr:MULTISPECIES: hypothetical protein [Actinomadura]MBO2460995.1 hypothetical protein [Actinomadura violacea]QKG18391.1 hypothetical protein ACTIVE_0025 [Actinomadura verrucosospora]